MSNTIYSEIPRHKRIARILIDYSITLEASAFVSEKFKTATQFAIENPYAFCLACCFDRQMPSDITWTIPWDMKNDLKGVDPFKINEMSLEELAALISRLPRKPRFTNDAPKTIKDLTRIVVEECDGDASNIWKGKPALMVWRTFHSIHGVGPGIVNMVLLLLERANQHQFSAEDHRWMDVKPDVHVIRVLYRVGLIENESETEAIEVTRRMYPEFPGIVDSGLWRIGRQWCRAQEPLCVDCVLRVECNKVGV